MKVPIEKEYEEIHSDMTKEELIAKIEYQCGWIDIIDAYRIVHFYTYEFGISITYMPIENELAWMYNKLKGKKVLKRDFYGGRKCIKCGLHKNPNEFYDRVKHKSCKNCMDKKRKMADN